MDTNELIEALRAANSAAQDYADEQKRHAEAGWAMASHWQERYVERAKAHDETIAALRDAEARVQRAKAFQRPAFLHTQQTMTTFSIGVPDTSKLRRDYDAECPVGLA